ncbi:efflux RND transporter periplasmic adaptor subunit [Arenibacter algicola]|uniref:efflux RND transporter periplasmic adaptor subunit n=1 Tax=Arenibacter algicola TaxID=616991 RepID=UPI001C068F79|nr:efflux RND transporter periplasmic adaptor subunit [Arenibacter algicola]MBU2907522.1 efflux RND transporter periplasmic adaptor subunit [Arenibacter algicola]
MNYISKIAVLGFTIFSLTACKDNRIDSAGINAENPETGHHEEDHISLTQSQAEDAGLTYGTFGQEEIKIPIETNGSIELPPNNMASISSLLDGFVVKINFLEGNVVKKGQVLVEMKDPAYVRLQQEYIGVYGRLNYLEQELERQQILNDADVGARKNLQQAQSEYSIKKAELAALKEQLNYAGISATEVENGKIQNRVYLRAPFGGTVTSVSAHSGEKVMSGQEIMQVINREHMHLELQLFQKDIPKVKKGQKVMFTIPAFEDSPVFEGEVSLVGRNLDLDSKTIRVHAHFKEDELLIPGLYTEAKIMQDSKKVRTLPTSAIVSDKGTSYFFIITGTNGSEINFEKVAFEPGIKSTDYVQIKNYSKVQDTTAIVVKGAFTLKAVMNKSEGGHQD